MRMKKYVRPVIVAADLLAEGVYLLSGESEPVALGEALNAATGADGKPENTEAADMTNGAEDSIGGTEPQPEGVGTDNETGSEGTEGTDTTDTTDTADTTEVASSNETQDTDADQDTAEDVVEDSRHRPVGLRQLTAYVEQFGRGVVAYVSELVYDLVNLLDYYGKRGNAVGNVV